MSERASSPVVWLFAVLGLLSMVAGPLTPPAAAAEKEDLRLLRLYSEMVTLAHERYGTEVDYRDLVYGSIQGALRRLDPHTSFLPPRSYSNMRERQQGTFYGVGILVSRRNGRVTVISPLEGAPAHRVGLRAGDIIVSVDGQTTESWSLDEAVDHIKGPKGTPVTLGIVRQGLSEPFTVTIIRDEIPQSTVRYAYMMTPEVGYVRLTDFGRSTASEMREALAALRSQGMKGLVLDLRNNGGGLLDQVVLVADLFLPAGSMIVSTSGRLPESYQELRAGDEEPELGLPLVVLVNVGTASAAEILAGAVQDHDVGLVVGTPTWGKGLVQTVYNLSYRSGIALTTSRYHTPSGRVIQRDYSDYFEYYTSRDRLQGAPQPSPPDSEVFHTDLGREVYGGGGITPDVMVDLPDLPEQLQLLYVHNALFDFAVGWTATHDVPSVEWEPDAELLPAFAAWLVEQEIVTPEAADEIVRDADTADMVLRQIHSDIFNAVFGQEAAHRVLARGDVQIQRGLELLDEAGQLLARRRSHPSGLASRAPAEPPPHGTRRDPRTEVDAALAPIDTMARGPGAAYAFLLGKGLGDEGAFAESLGAFARSLELDGSDPYQYLEPARLYTWLARSSRDPERGEELLDAALERVSTARELLPANLDVLREVADIQLRRVDRDRSALGQAEEALRGVLAEEPDDVESMVALATVYRYQRRPEKAVAVLGRAESQLPTLPVRSRLAQAMLEAGDLAGAQEVLEKILAQQPGSLDHWLLLVDLASRQGDHRRAVELIRSAPAEIRAESRVQERLERELELAGEEATDRP